MTNGDDYAGQPDTSSSQTDTAIQPTQATSADYQDPSSSQQTVTTSDTGDQVLPEAVQAYNDDRKRLTDSQAYYQQMTKQIADINQRIQAMPSPTPPQHIPIPSLPDQQMQQRQQNGNIGTMLAQGIMIAGIASVVFGRRHNPWATAAITSGLGSFISGFTKAQHELATEQLSNWNKSVEYAVKQNQEADRTYNEILANKRLDLTQQMDLIKTISAQRQDVEMYKAATTKDLNQIIRVVENHEKANEAMSRAQIDVNSRAANIWLKSKVGNAWSIYVQEQSKKDGHYIDPTAPDGGKSFREARDKYSPSQWMDSHTTSGAAKKAAKPVTFESYEKEAKAALGKDSEGKSNVDKWQDVIDGQEQPVRGDFDKDGNWKTDPKGSRYATPDSVKPRSGLLGAPEGTPFIGAVTHPNPAKSDTALVKTIDALKQLRARVTAGGSTGEEEKSTGGAVKTAKDGTVLKIQTPLSPEDARAKIASGELKPGDWFETLDGQYRQVNPQ